MARFAFLSTLFVIAQTGLASAQAFGVQMGQKAENLKTLENLGNGSYKINAPLPHPEFEGYVAVVGPTTGVCLVRGVGKNHANDKFGLSIRQKFTELETALQKNYGRFLKTDFLRSGSIWRESSEWVMAIKQNERAYEAAWDKTEGSKLPDGLTEIILYVAAADSSTSWIGLQYRFSNNSACKA